MRVMSLKETHPRAKVELWCADEQRPGLKPLVVAGCGPPWAKGLP